MRIGVKHSVIVDHVKYNKWKIIKNYMECTNEKLIDKAIEIMKELPDGFGENTKDKTINIELTGIIKSEEFTKERIRTGYKCGEIVRAALDAIIEDYEDGML